MPKKWFWLVGLLGAGMLFYQVQATTPQDPLISLSYLELRIESLKVEVKQWIQEALQTATLPVTPTDPVVPTEPTTPSEPDSAPAWEVITLQKGERLVVNAGCEMILRAGKAYAIASFNGGLADLTEGIDLTTGVDVPTNHHLIVPRSDGRGLGILDLSYVMIKGEYEIQTTP